MSTNQHPTNDAETPRPRRPLSDEENRRAVNRIETAERESPWCVCGEPTTPASHGDSVWLECRTVGEPRRGVSRFLPWTSGLWHTRRLILELPN